MAVGRWGGSPFKGLPWCLAFNSHHSSSSPAARVIKIVLCVFALCVCVCSAFFFPCVVRVLHVRVPLAVVVATIIRFSLLRFSVPPSVIFVKDHPQLASPPPHPVSRLLLSPSSFLLSRQSVGLPSLFGCLIVKNGLQPRPHPLSSLHSIASPNLHFLNFCINPFLSSTQLLRINSSNNNAVYRTTPFPLTFFRVFLSCFLFFVA